ncbi:UBA domain-containing protein 7 [Grifola frondosa]|uniref:UBA domain-containing protein 7 n=1 Tax=Grifola frondosa TaxID=5627 RepID=A0A1C7LZL5_GRIFR|nr:UBA domain-containing protein 7 [Grifola frondosa]
MSDAFADLWNSTGAAKPVEAPRKLGSITPVLPASRNPKNDVFSMLAASGSSSSVNSRAITPTYTGSSPSLASNLPARSTQKPVSSGGDAFSNLLSGSLASSSTNGAHMTMAQRAVQAEKERKAQMQTQSSTFAHPPSASSAWDGLDALGSRSTVQRLPATSSRHAEDDEWNFGSQPAPAKTTLPAEDDDWGLGELTLQPLKSKPIPTSKSAASSQQLNDLLEFEEFTSASPHPPAHSPSPSIPRSNTPGDFDFGDREDRLLDDNDSDTEDDILGALSKPVDKLTPNRSARASPAPHPPQSSKWASSPQQARVALASTDTGLDVQAALEILLANGAGAHSPAPEEPRDGARAPTREPGHERYYESDEEEVAHPHRSQAQPSRPSAQRRFREQPAKEVAQATSDTQRQLQEHADKLLAQASEIGLTVFNRANAFWKEGKERVQKAYEERAAATASSRAAPGADGSRRNTKPKWMADVVDHENDDPALHDGVQGVFNDDHEAHPSSRSRARFSGSQTQESQSAPEPLGSRVKTGNLFSDDPQRSPASSSSSSPAPRVSSPVPLIQRKTVSATPSEIADSAKQKAAGTEMFKLGRYAEAETLYSVAIAALPDTHLLLVPLYNNRALTRLKTGEHTGAIEDCTAAIGLIGVDLADGLLKALRRRAEAYEGREKWDAARQDWEAIAAAEWAGKARTEAVMGAGRCRRMLSSNVNTGASSPAPVPPAPKPKPQRKRAAEAEDQERYELKDGVDARLSAWKGGKETNIRALIASLEMVLWPELGWQKVGMHELVTPAQVKIRYTKAIAKLHPDKLNVHNTTLEQRMIANGVFGVMGRVTGRDASRSGFVESDESDQF